MSTVIMSHASGLRRSGATRYLGDLVRRVADMHRRHRERAQLRAVLGMSDYQLKDIGLQRHDIQREALKPFWKS